MNKNKLYKIGTVSKLLGIPTQTLRYFEDCGFVHPTTDQESGYRYYNAWDLNFLMECRYMRSLGFPNAVVEEMLHKNNSKSLLTNYIQQEHKLIDEIHQLEKTRRIDKRTQKT
ncbi:MAG: MerR family transcriptional regulator [Eubacteriaceae bacterium]|nr:MerR family transcriptional regulator [Eubacteriaceae bacterium]